MCNFYIFKKECDYWCCWRVNLFLFQFGRKDTLYYIEILNKEFWLTKKEF
jgi:hypothetical protein